MVESLLSGADNHGSDMKRALVETFVLIAAISLMSASVAASGSLASTSGTALEDSGDGYVDRFQSVSGDFARSWLQENLEDNVTEDESSLVNDLWNWGGIPRGKALVNGQLVDVNNTTVIANKTANWLGITPYLDYYTSGKWNASEWMPPF